MTAIAKVPFKSPWSSGEWTRHVDHDGHVHIHHDGRLLTLYTKSWSDDARVDEEGNEREPDEEVTEVYYDPTPVFVVEELRRRGVGFGSYATEVGDIAETLNGTDEFYVAGYGRPVAREEQVSAFLHGFTPKQLEIINAHVDARPGTLKETA
ncbi:hypothetical protein E3_1850 [Rhodococcus phage E3]|uniref:hypothetical protein n=1 Tax=Rhodococcus phage E3 TaxID=1007869 RepID=UPI0002C69C22|nr:hypothetical protein M176_gp195 [Rhodococcus phage E3]AEQ21103.1 hypothetical protein E3_1850 [Rhodococcus phage E3]